MGADVVHLIAARLAREQSFHNKLNMTPQNQMGKSFQTKRVDTSLTPISKKDKRSLLTDDGEQTKDDLVRMKTEVVKENTLHSSKQSSTVINEDEREDFGSTPNGLDTTADILQEIKEVE